MHHIHRIIHILPHNLGIQRTAKLFKTSLPPSSPACRDTDAPFRKLRQLSEKSQATSTTTTNASGFGSNGLAQGNIQASSVPKLASLITPARLATLAAVSGLAPFAGKYAIFVSHPIATSRFDQIASSLPETSPVDTIAFNASELSPSPPMSNSELPTFDYGTTSPITAIGTGETQVKTVVSEPSAALVFGSILIVVVVMHRFFLKCSKP